MQSVDAGSRPWVEPELEAYRHELRAYCYRMLGSIFDADDAVQDTLLRAWEARERFEGTASLRSWLYRIATNVCIDRLRGARRRALPMDLSSPASPHVAPDATLPEYAWIEPAPTGELLGIGTDPADQALMRESIRIAFIALLQRLPPRQRAAVILRDVLHWQAREVAELLGASVASVNSLLQRARSVLAAARSVDDVANPNLRDARERELLERYMAYFEAYDVDSLVALIREDATMSMPPFVYWLRGRSDIRTFLLGTGQHCKGSWVVPVQVNGSPGFAQYLSAGAGGMRDPWAIHVLEIQRGEIGHVHTFIGPALFARLGLPHQSTD